MRFIPIVLALFLAACQQEPLTTFSRVKKDKQILIATSGVNVPFAFSAGTALQGFDVDIGNAIAEKIGVHARWINRPFQQLFDLLEKKEVDLVIGAISITEERKKRFDFSEPYFLSGQAIAIRKENKEIKNLKDLEGKKVGVLDQSTGHLFVQNESGLNGVEIQAYTTLDDALLALNGRELDGVVGDRPILQNSIRMSFSHLQLLDQKLDEEKYGVAVRKGDGELLAVVNQTLQELERTGRFDEWVKKWFGAEYKAE
ncbi:MAG: amino acid ABC transporter substrate-binding protein [Acidobacteria bacterium]|nr:amino acid ABC transporter substrate-binding protein [Acidobacteriota bacterium]